ncbi:MAG: hypothetical protein IKM46_01040 [Clostridia bacterium]|nr:hypothetical protein [Clostridia bacterium]
MKTAVIGSRKLKTDNIGEYLPADTCEIVSGGAAGVDTSAKEYAIAAGLKYTEFLPEYKLYGRGALIVRNRKIVDYADLVVAFRDGKSRGTKWTVNYCISNNIPLKIIYCKE